MTETVFEETEVAKTVREIRSRDPSFDMVRFLRNLKQDVQPVIQVSLLPTSLILCHPPVQVSYSSSFKVLLDKMSNFF